ncbi:MAG: hypothetical protein HZB35_04485 [Nitrospirae bacterium]|nr:hypothetical protein [Nitrospirota bacterium]
MRRSLRQSLLPLVLTLASMPGALHAGSSSGSSLAAHVERAKLATIGVLQEGQGNESQAGRARFSVRGSGFHFRDGYIVTARHVVDREESGKRVVPQEIRVLTTALQEFPAMLVGPVCCRSISPPAAAIRAAGSSERTAVWSVWSMPSSRPIPHRKTGAALDLHSPSPGL